MGKTRIEEEEGDGGIRRGRNRIKWSREEMIKWGMMEERVIRKGSKSGRKN